MSLLPMILLPDPLLRRRSDPVEHVDDELRRFADDMLETMYDAPGIGLAAVQVGVPRRIITIDVAQRDAVEADPTDPSIVPRPAIREPIVMVNPEIVFSGDERSTYEEGCLSIPDYYADVERPGTVRVRWTDLDGKTHEREDGGLFAVCVQHEIDHLDGTLFIDHLSRLKRERTIKKFVKMAKEAGRPVGGERPILA